LSFIRYLSRKGLYSLFISQRRKDAEAQREEGRGEKRKDEVLVRVIFLLLSSSFFPLFPSSPCSLSSPWRLGVFAPLREGFTSKGAP
jgi:hypothetical protein